jgi:hypothetical protein
MKFTVFGVALLLMTGPATVFADDLDDALDALKQAQPSKDTAKIKELAAAAHAVAQKYEGPPPADADKESYAARSRYAKDVEKYSEYALFTAASQSPASAADLISTLEKQNPKSEYLEYPRALMIMVENARAKKQMDRAVSYANRLIAAANGKPPQGAESEWEATKSSGLGLGYFVVGSNACDKQQWNPADKNLRAALPLVKGNAGMAQPTLFCLGLANYNIGKLTQNKAKMLEAVEFSKQAAAIAGPLQDPALKNSFNIKTEADRMR